MTNALAYNQLISCHAEQHATQYVPARRPGITTGFITGKKLPHDSAK